MGSERRASIEASGVSMVATLASFIESGTRTIELTPASRFYIGRSKGRGVTPGQGMGCPL
ncbi:MAG: hypothetical protein C3F11_14055 [Methylocystaceae bacterium]|nr:MAG: hypothetical protein C3F11_14055 [Methylocystaceae bacterium]